MNAIVAQCGGPTPVINATLAAVIAAWQEQGEGVLYGSRHGFEGLLGRDWVTLSPLGAEELARLAQQPAAALGGSRYRPHDDEFDVMAANLRAGGIGAVFLIGGNGTMAGARRLAAAGLPRSSLSGSLLSGRPLPDNAEIQVIGVPKTIDNDLPGCDVTPGYGSAARYVAHTVQEIGLDLRAMRGFDQVAVVEVMGRHVGWLAAAAALARSAAGDPPHLILLPEVPVATDEVLQRIEQVYAEQGICAAVVAEGVRERGPAGAYWAELVDGAAYDGSGQRVFSMSAGASAYLVKQVQEQLGLRSRQIKLNTAQRATRLLASSVDRELAARVGRAAVDAWRQGRSGVLPVIVRQAGAGHDSLWQTETVPLEAVAGRERALPAEYIAAENYDVTDACRAYIAAVIGEPPPRPLLWID